MIKFIIRRLLSLIPVILGVTFFVFMVMQLAPGDAAKLLLGEGATQEQVEELREEMGLNDPVIVQYVRYMVNFCKGDLGTSYATKRPVADEVFSRFPYTFNLSIVAGIVSILLAIPLGILAAVKQNTFFDNISMVISLVGVSMPIFWLALYGLHCQNDQILYAGDSTPGLYPDSKSERSSQTGCYCKACL